MVCLDTSTKVKSENIEGNTKNTMVDCDDDRLRLKRLAGGSIIDYPPTFSPDGELLFTIFQNVVHVYSTSTGEWLRNLEGPQANIIGLQFELENSKILCGMSETGELYRWKWKSGQVEKKQQLQLPKCCISTFNLVDKLPDSKSALLTYTTSDNNVKWCIIDLNTGETLKCPANIKLKEGKVRVSVENKFFHYFALIQKQNLYVVNYKNGIHMRWKSTHIESFTRVQVHPTEEMIATGDKMGRIYFWRHIFSGGEPQNTIYHWHHTPISSISFTESGTSFYSSGHEAVLVKWNIERPDIKEFLPRMPAKIVHIAVGYENRRTAVCTADNGIHILGMQNQAKCILQNFTYIYDDKTDLDKFPIGIKLNPRTNTLALNGRVGHLQFYSTYTKSLLYNIDVCIQNRMSEEKDKILYDIRVTCAAFNIDWMATGEVWNDQEHALELRLKFWEFNKEQQNYALNTCIELPHEGGFKAIEFSNQLQAENLLCATVGDDDVIKIWTLEDPDNIYKAGKVWICIAQTNYKNFTLNSINFSQDGSLLAAGYGNALCIYKADTLKLKAVLSAPCPYDGIVKKVQITLPKNTLNGARSNQKDKNELIEKRKRVLDLFKGLLEGNNKELLTEFKKNKTKSSDKRKSQTKKMPLATLNSKHQEFVFKKIVALTELSLFQKIAIFQKLGVFCTVSKESQNRFLNYVIENIITVRKMEDHLTRMVKDISTRDRFKAKYRLQKYITRRKNYMSSVNKKLVPLMKVLNLNINDAKSDCDVTNNKKCNGFTDNVSENIEKSDAVNGSKIPLIHGISSIKHVLFGTGEFAHLVVVCTEHRVLIWNILTLRLQSVLTLSVYKIVVDPMTSLIAAFTNNKELYVFLPNAPMPIYHRINLPTIYGAVWVPRRYPKSQSINLDWQSISILYFLTERQELMYLATDSDVDHLSSATTFLNEPQDITRYSTFGVFAAKQTNLKVPYNSSSISVITNGKSSVKSFIETATHTMAPVNLLCNNFIKALLITDVQKNPTEDVAGDDGIAGEKQDESEDEPMDEDQSIKLKRMKFNNSSRPATPKDALEQVRTEEKLRQVLKEKVEIKF